MSPFARFMRKKRMRLFQNIITPAEGMRVLDLGGRPEIWDYVKPVLEITCLNLPGILNASYETHHKIKFVEGDACNIADYNFGDFDIVFSNSVLEHVGDIRKRIQFANEVKRLSKTYWVQTPCKYFPIEAHCGMPFWWFYPQWLKTYFLSRWSKKLPAWAEMVSGTTVISEPELKNLLPDSTIITEYFIFPKSLVAYSVGSPKQD
jgi:hypothetical protein